jgi:SAM-dependent methyltransferase
MFTIWKKFNKSVRQCGLWGATCHAVCPGRWRRARRAAIEAAVRDFDLPCNVDTGGLIPISQLNIGSENRKYGYPNYEAVLPREFHAMMRAAGDVASGRVFVDLGCGKGRALLLASEYPFQRIVGVEFAAELVEVARKNLLSYRNARQVCRALEVVLGDATEYPLPDEPLVLFLQNPFGGIVMEGVVEQVRCSLEKHPRPLTVVYGNPYCERLWDAVPSLKKVAKAWRTPAHVGYVVYHYHR